MAVGIRELVRNAYAARSGNRAVEVEGHEMGHSDAAEAAALELWPWLNGKIEKAVLVKRAGDWRTYRVYYESGDVLDSMCVAVCRLNNGGNNGK